MPILPSTLEYSITNFQKKIDLIINGLDRYLELSHQEVLELHVDLVYPFFARENSVMSSISLIDNLRIIYDMVEKLQQKCFLTIHFMGLLDDVILFNRHLEKIKKHKLINMELYIPLNLNQKMFINSLDLPIYYWYDIDQYSKINTKDQSKKLLMTVKAGKSGQVIKEESYNKTLKIIEDCGVSNIIIDGGLKIKDYLKYLSDNKQDLRMVSYSSFWNNFL